VSLGRVLIIPLVEHIEFFPVVRGIINTLPSDTHRTNLSIKRGRTQCALSGKLLILYLVTPIVRTSLVLPRFIERFVRWVSLGRVLIFPLTEHIEFFPVL
jgi:hypothetical protein